MGVMATAVFKGVAVTAVQDLFEVKAGSAATIKVHGFCISQTTELGDAQEEQLRLTTNRGTGAVTSGSGGSTPTVTPAMRGAPVTGVTVEANNTTQIAVGSGTLTTDLEVHNWNERVPYLMIYPPEMRPIILPSDYWTLELETTPSDSVTISGTIWLEIDGV